MTRRSAYGRCCGLTLAGILAGCGGSSSDGPGIVNAPAVVAVTVSQPAVNPIDIGGTVQLTVEVQAQNGAPTTVRWSSSAPNVATVDQSGLVTGVTGGQATITATSVYNASRAGSAGIAVNPPRIAGITLGGAKGSMRFGESFQIVASVDARGPIAKTVSFASSNVAAATVSSGDGITGTITGVGVGSTTITVTSSADATKTATFSLAVTGTARITNVTPSTVSLRPGGNVKLTPTVQPDPGVSSAVTYQSQNTAIATVSLDGTVTGIALGQTTVIVTALADAQQKFTVPVTVRSGVTSVSLTPDRDSVRRGATHQLTLNVVAESGVSNTVQLTSANPAIATIDGSARIAAVAIGQTYVRAISTVDQTVGDSTLVVVVDPCSYFQPLPLGVVVNGAVTDLSCNQAIERLSYSLNSQTALTLTASGQFAASFGFAGDKSLFYNGNDIGGGSPATNFVVLAAGRYYAQIWARDVGSRGPFTVSANTVDPMTTSACFFVVTAGITVTVPLRSCGFQPQGRPAGTYYSLHFGMLPSFQPGDRLTVTVTAPSGIIPLVETTVGNNSPVQVTGTSSTLVATFTAPIPGTTQFAVSTRDAGLLANVTVKVEGPPSIPADAIAVGYLISPHAGTPMVTSPRPHPLVRPRNPR